MTEDEKEKAKATAAVGAGAGVGTAGGASVGVLQLAAQGTVTGLSAGVVIGVGTLAGAPLCLGGEGGYPSIKKEKGKMTGEVTVEGGRRPRRARPGAFGAWVGA